MNEIEDVIPLPNVKLDIFELILEFLKGYQIYEKKCLLENKKPNNNFDNPELTEFGKIFFEKISKENKFALVLAANYLDFKFLLDELSCNCL